MATELQVVNSALTKIGAPLITQAQYDSGSTKEARLTKERISHVRQDLLRSHPWNVAVTRTEASPLFSSITAGGVAMTHYTTGDVWKWVADPSSPSTTYVSRTTVGGITHWTYVVSGASLASNFGWASTGWDLDVMQSPPLSGWATPSNVAYDNPIAYTTIDSSGADRGDVGFGYAYRIKLPSDFVRLLSVDDDDDDSFRVEGGYIHTDDSSPQLLYISDLALTSFDPNLTETLAWKLGFDISYAITQSQGVWEMAERGYEMSLRRAKTIDAQEDGRYHVEANLFDDSRYGNSIFADYRNHHRP